MSLYINPEEVTQVLLADGWHEVKKETFGIDAYEFVQPGFESPDHDYTILSGGSVEGICSTGFHFVEVDETAGGAIVYSSVYGPMTAVLAVRAA